MAAIIRYEDLKIGTKDQKTIKTKLITKFGNIAYISQPLSKWVRLSYFSSTIETYFIKVSNGLQYGMVVFL
jgi:hypothetical protein